jgi:hypothetical protein
MPHSQIFSWTPNQTSSTHALIGVANAAQGQEWLRREIAWEHSRKRPITLPFLFIGVLRRLDRHNLKSWLLSLHFPMLTPYRPTVTLEIASVVSTNYAQNKVVYYLAVSQSLPDKFSSLHILNENLTHQRAKIMRKKYSLDATNHHWINHRWTA